MKKTARFAIVIVFLISVYLLWTRVQTSLPKSGASDTVALGPQTVGSREGSSKKTVSSDSDQSRDQHARTILARALEKRRNAPFLVAHSSWSSKTKMQVRKTVTRVITEAGTFSREDYVSQRGTRNPVVLTQYLSPEGLYQSTDGAIYLLPRAEIDARNSVDAALLYNFFQQESVQEKIARSDNSAHSESFTLEKQLGDDDLGVIVVSRNGAATAEIAASLLAFYARETGSSGYSKNDIERILTDSGSRSYYVDLAKMEILAETKIRRGQPVTTHYEYPSSLPDNQVIGVMPPRGSNLLMVSSYAELSDIIAKSFLPANAKQRFFADLRGS